MTKQEKAIVEEYYKNYNIDLRTMKMVVYHYLDIGERTAKGLTQEFIDEIYQRELEKEKEAESRGCIYMIAPDFTAYLLTACLGLSKLEDKVRYKLIKEWL